MCITAYHAHSDYVLASNIRGIGGKVIQSFHMAFNRRGGSRFGGGRPSFGKRRFDGGDRGDRQMYQATCSDCGQECEVPFRPTGSKPVLCNACFKKDGGGSFENKKFGRPGFDRPARQNDDQLAAINTKLDKILKILEPPME